MELEFKAQTVIDRPPAQVFAFVAVDHCTNHPLWDPSVLRIVPPADGRMALGAHLDIVRRTLGRTESLTFEVTDWRPPSGMTITTRSRNFDLSLASDIEPIAGGQSRLVLHARARVSGPRAVLVPIMKMKFAAEIRNNLLRIKRHMEAGAVPSPAPA
jgi:polyketide cyclase/dehydrase/lipid transport protein